MKRIASYDLEVIKYKSEIGFLTIFGMPFLLSGICVMAIPLLELDINLQGPMSPWYFSMSFGIIFTLVGMSLVFGRSGFSIDKRMGVVNKWWSVIMTIKSKNYPFKEFNLVRVTKEVRRSDQSTYSLYPVKLVGKDAEITLYENQNYKKQRRMAENIAKFSGFSMADSSSGEEIIRSPELLNESVRDRIRRTGKISEIPPAPTVTKMTYDIKEREICFVIPSTPMDRLILCIFFIAGLAPLGFFIFIASFAIMAPIPWFIKIFFTLIFCLPGVITLLILLRRATKKTQLRVSPNMFSLTEQWRLGPKKQEIPTNELEELQIVEKPCTISVPDKWKALFFNDIIIANSDKLSLQFGRGLSLSELQWLHAVIENMVSM